MDQGIDLHDITKLDLKFSSPGNFKFQPYFSSLALSLL